MSQYAILIAALALYMVITLVGPSLEMPLSRQQESVSDMTLSMEGDSNQRSVQLLCSPKQDHKHNQRHSSQPYQAPTTPSLFNCQRPSEQGHGDSASSLCRYFYPANFFDTNCGLGRDYAYMVTETEERLRQRRLWRSGPRIGFNIFTTKFKFIMDSSTNSSTGKASPRRITLPVQTTKAPDANSMPPSFAFPEEHWERLAYIHVHKAGGTSMRDTQNILTQQGYGQTHRLRWFHPRNPVEIEPQRYMETIRTIRQAVRYPLSFNLPEEKAQEEDDDDQEEDYGESAGPEATLPQEVQPFVLYTLVRDPVTRFISSIGQVMGSAGSTGPVAVQFRKACLKATPVETLACSIQYVRNHSVTGFEVHFAPQALEIAFGTVWHDVPVAVFSMEESLSTVLATFSEQQKQPTTTQQQRVNFGLPSKLPRRAVGNQTAVPAWRRATASTTQLQSTTTTKTQILSRRNGTTTGYRPHPVLTQMSVNDFTAPLLRDVCHLYAVDVLMLQSLEIPNRCDKILLVGVSHPSVLAWEKVRHNP